MVQHARQDKTRQLEIAPHLWLWWTLATTIAGAIVGVLEASGFEFLATLFFTGLLIGAAQWLVLRQYIPKAPAVIAHVVLNLPTIPVLVLVGMG